MGFTVHTAILIIARRVGNAPCVWALALSLNLRSRAFMTSLPSSPITTNTVSTATSTAMSPNASPNTRPLAGVTTSSVCVSPPTEKKRHASFKKKTKRTGPLARMQQHIAMTRGALTSTPTENHTLGFSGPLEALLDDRDAGMRNMDGFKRKIEGVPFRD